MKAHLLASMMIVATVVLPIVAVSGPALATSPPTRCALGEQVCACVEDIYGDLCNGSHGQGSDCTGAVGTSRDNMKGIDCLSAELLA